MSVVLWPVRSRRTRAGGWPRRATGCRRLPCARSGAVAGRSSSASGRPVATGATTTPATRRTAHICRPTVSSQSPIANRESLCATVRMDSTNATACISVALWMARSAPAETAAVSPGRETERARLDGDRFEPGHRVRRDAAARREEGAPQVDRQRSGDRLGHHAAGQGRDRHPLRRRAGSLPRLRDRSPARSLRSVQPGVARSASSCSNGASAAVGKSATINPLARTRPLLASVGGRPVSTTASPGCDGRIVARRRDLDSHPATPPIGGGRCARLRCPGT